MKSVLRVLCLLALLLASAPPAARGQDRDPAAGPTGFGRGEDAALPDFLALYDLDEDGQLSVEERQALRIDRERHLKFRNRWDLDRDGTITEAERDAARVKIRRTIEEQRRRRFLEVDANGDRTLSRAEFEAIPAVQVSDANTPGVADSLFDHIDVDPKDDRISVEEFLAALDRPESPPETDKAALETTRK